MEFYEKLQELRKRRGMTQEELAEVLFVSRAAVSKWESGRGYPGIDSLKALSGYFCVTIDELLSGERLLSIAEKERQAGIQNICDLAFGLTDLFAFLLIVLPLYPKTIGGYVYAVNLFSYTETALRNRTGYWIVFTVLILMGALKILLKTAHADRMQKIIAVFSLLIGVLAVFFLALAGETYAVILVFSLLLVKGILFIQTVRIRLLPR